MNNEAMAWQVAWHWLCQRRRHAPSNADIWHLRFHWAQQGDWLYQHLQSGYCQLALMQVFRRGGRSWVQWCVQDALVLKWAALLVERYCQNPRVVCVCGDMAVA
ncbi:hypothetical protein [Enterobacter kobei]|uniref:hypothetical protein n=1 Tax=Enterobacter kobei TaxID=208224 RepID=UPI002A82F505|nr:hypothetical protein [Enterobacter kobei]